MTKNVLVFNPLPEMPILGSFNSAANKDIFNPLPEMPILGSFNSAANKDMR